MADYQQRADAPAIGKQAVEFCECDACLRRRRAAPEMLAALEEAALQIEYLHEKFHPTGSGNMVLGLIRAAIRNATGAA